MPPDLPSKIFVLDNGGYAAKAGYITDSTPKIIPNYITKVKSERRRVFVGNQLDECKDYSGLFYLYAFERGFLLNWDVQKQVWDFIFRDTFNVDFSDTCLIITEPYFNFVSMQETITEILFEDYKFHSILRINPGALSAYHYLKDKPSELCCMVVDSGFSFTHIIPHIKGKKLRNATCRMDVGGKLLTNHLKEIISYRQLNVMDETYVMNQVKEDVCYVSNNFSNDLKISQLRGKDNTIVCDYVLPDYTVIKRGYVRTVEETSKQPKDAVEQFIRMNSERIQVPEILFHPSDVALPEMGICEGIHHCTRLCPEEVQPHMTKNILLTGGNTLFPGFRDRVLKDVRSFSEDLVDINVTLPENPITYAWEGGTLLSQDPEFSKMIVTRKQFEEHRLSFCLDKFDV